MKLSFYFPNELQRFTNQKRKINSLSLQTFITRKDTELPKN